MANSILTPQAITRESLRILMNSSALLKNVDRQYDDQFARDNGMGGKIGNTLRIRLPNDYTYRTGPTAVPQNTTELNTAITLATQGGVDLSFSMADRTLSLQDYSKRFITPAMNVIAAGMSADLMSGAEAIPNLIHNVDGSGNTLPPNFTTWATAGGVLDAVPVPRGNRKIVFDPITQAKTVSSFSGLFNNQEKVARQYSKGEIANDVLGFDWMMDQTTIKHTTGAYGVLPTVNGAGQSGNTITVSALNGPLNLGDVVSFAGVYAINRVTKQTTGQLAQFALTAPAAAGATSLSIYPALTPAVGGLPVPYQTVTASPANGAQVTCATNAGETYRMNIAMDPSAVTLVTADLELPRGVHEAHRETYAGISIRLVSFYTGLSDQMVTRLDILYGYKWLRPEFCVRVADSL